MDKPHDVDAYIANADERARPHLVELRRLILATVPGVTESISWGVPFYRYHGALAGLAVYRAHVSFGVGEGELGDERRAALERQGSATGKKTFQVKFEQPVPVETIVAIIRVQAEENKRKRP
jgi:uncharacterized protein YdhG (YjbR/CyaY superfamily)